jgi:hypothetical protein
LNEHHAIFAHGGGRPRTSRVASRHRRPPRRGRPASVAMYTSSGDPPPGRRRARRSSYLGSRRKSRCPSPFTSASTCARRKDGVGHRRTRRRPCRRRSA